MAIDFELWKKDEQPRPRVGVFVDDDGDLQIVVRQGDEHDVIAYIHGDSGKLILLRAGDPEEARKAGLALDEENRLVCRRGGTDVERLT